MACVKKVMAVSNWPVEKAVLPFSLASCAVRGGGGVGVGAAEDGGGGGGVAAITAGGWWVGGNGKSAVFLWVSGWCSEW